MSATPMPSVASRSPGNAAAVRWLSDDRYSIPLGAMAWVLLVLMIVPEGLRYDTLSTAPASGSALSRALWLGLLATGLMVIAWRAALASLLVRWLNPFLAALVALAVVSVAWSIEPSLTLRRSIRVVTILVVCVAFVLGSWHQR
ncbi:MAG: hypothetical protein ABI661_05410, partial [Gammaproteobacteria bacterium]